MEHRRGNIVLTRGGIECIASRLEPLATGFESFLAISNDACKHAQLKTVQDSFECFASFSLYLVESQEDSRSTNMSSSNVNI